MSRAPQSFKQRDMTRAIKAAQAAGLTAYRIEIVNGNPAIIVGGNVDNPKDADVKSWDEAISEQSLTRRRALSGRRPKPNTAGHGLTRRSNSTSARIRSDRRRGWRLRLASTRCSDLAT